MNLWVLDTDSLSHLELGHPRVLARCASVALTQRALTIISVEERFLGWHSRALKARTPQQLAHIYQRWTRSASLLGQLQLLTFSITAIARYEALQRLKLNIGKKDLRIAAIVLDAGATRVTGNTRDFQRVPGLRVEDWTQ